jgi:polar amino acid transport system substrate-binding protein
LKNRWFPGNLPVWVLGVSFLLAAAGLHKAFGQPAEKRPLVWASDAEGGAPYIFKDPNDPDRNIGFEVDLAAALAEELGRPVQFKQYAFESLIPGVNRGDFDFAMNGIEVTPDRREKVRFSKPYYVYKLQLVVRAGESRIDGLADCLRLRAVVGTLGDTAAERLFDRLGIPKRVYDSQREPYVDLVQRQVDAVLMDLPIALYYAQPEPTLRYAQSNPDVRFAGKPIGKGYYAIAFAKDNETLAGEVDAALDRLKEKGVLRRIYKKWGLWNDSQEELMPDDPVEGDGETKASTADAEGWSFRSYLHLLLIGAARTVEISVLGMLLAMALGLPIALARLYGPGPLRGLATVYVEFFRGIPILLLLFFLYYGLPGMAQHYGWAVSLKLAPFAAAVLGFGLNYAAYEAEIYRAGICAIPVGQWEAAASLGMSRGLTFRRIILPQAVRTILPPTTSDFVALFKDTSIVSIIALDPPELTKQYQILAKSSGHYLEIGLATATLYLLMSVPLGYLSRYLEKRWSRGAAD